MDNNDTNLSDISFFLMILSNFDLKFNMFQRDTKFINVTKPHLPHSTEL